jgi:hypothetical protein
VQLYAGLPVGNLLLYVMLLLTICLIADFISSESITVITLEVTAESVLKV